MSGIIYFTIVDITRCDWINVTILFNTFIRTIITCHCNSEFFLSNVILLKFKNTTKKAYGRFACQKKKTENGWLMLFFKMKYAKKNY